MTIDPTLSGGGSTSHTNSYELAGSFGAEYALGRRFSLFGELGLAYAHGTSSFRSSGATSSGTSTGTDTRFATRTAVGVVIWF
jgi:opacity protein-like surface antigen